MDGDCDWRGADVIGGASAAGRICGARAVLLHRDNLDCGLGAMFMYVRDVWYQSDRRVLSPRTTTTMRTVPPPPSDEDDAVQAVPLGMDNLPPGFTGFED